MGQPITNTFTATDLVILHQKGTEKGKLNCKILIKLELHVLLILRLWKTH